MAELKSQSEGIVIFTVLRRATVNNGSADGLQVRVIQEATLSNGYAVVVSNNGEIGWVLPSMLR